ncbi:hypothetical protein L345_14102 [Ophiophagus hannah]|uniref:Uncharacterized protein n=1 Tax=Ophiophagus hannah TaxID=8665 RepID=V8NEU5_OPHHA|nr:hypothetical protein L345_14102 [Ophiophagus hannah]
MLKKKISTGSEKTQGLQMYQTLIREKPTQQSGVFKNSHLANNFSHMLQQSSIEDWLITDETFIIMKDKIKATPDNFCPNNCLSTTFKLWTRIIASKMYPASNNSLP